MTRRGRPRAPRAYLLLEAIVSGAILLVGLVGVLSGLANLSVSATRMRDFAIARTIIQDAAEEISILPRSELSNVVPKSFDGRGHLILTPSTSQAKFLLSIVPEVLPNTPAISRVTITVEWPAGSNHSIQLVTFKS